MEHPRRRLNDEDFTVACICPMGAELALVVAMLDELHERLPTSRDMNSYTLGHTGAHNIVIVVMPEIGNNGAATVATQLLNDFTSTEFGLSVGIGGGVPQRLRTIFDLET
jgi:nucleoside phosphorylase